MFHDFTFFVVIIKPIFSVFFSKIYMLSEKRSFFFYESRKSFQGWFRDFIFLSSFSILLLLFACVFSHRDQSLVTKKKDSKSLYSLIINFLFEFEILQKIHKGLLLWSWNCLMIRIVDMVFPWYGFWSDIIKNFRLELNISTESLNLKPKHSKLHKSPKARDELRQKK